MNGVVAATVADEWRWRRGVFLSVPVLVVFAFLVASWSVQYVVDIYAHPVLRALFVPSYLVTMVTYDGGLGLEILVNPVASALPVGGAVLWELGNVLTYYLVALALGGPAWLFARRGSDGGANGESAGT
jgi:hypothetical protein